MLVSPISHTQHPVQPQARSADESNVRAVAESVASPSANGKLNLFDAAQLYLQKASELANLSKQTGKYEVETLSDSEIKSLFDAGVPMEAFLRQYGQKLGSREFGALAELIMKSVEKQDGPTASDATAPQAAALTITARAYV